MALVKVITVSLPAGRRVALRSGTQLNPVEGEVEEVETGAATWAEVLQNGQESGARDPIISSGQRLTGEAGTPLNIQSQQGDNLLLTTEDFATPGVAGSVRVQPGISIDDTGAPLVLNGGNSNTIGGEGRLFSGIGGADSGDMRVGSASSPTRSGGLFLTTGSAVNAGGIVISAATSAGANGSNIDISAGDSAGAGLLGGSVNIGAGDGLTGGDVNIGPGNGATKGRLKILNPGGTSFTWPATDGAIADSAPLSNGAGLLAFAKVVVGDNARDIIEGSITNATGTPVQMAALNFDPIKAGWYRIHWYAECSCNSAGASFYMEALQGATVLGRIRTALEVDTSDTTIFTGFTELNLAAGSQLYQIQGFMAVGGPTLSVQRRRLTIERLGS